jgi:hypothetical protein
VKLKQHPRFGRAVGIDIWLTSDQDVIDANSDDANDVVP